MLPDRVSNPGPLTYESSALPIALRGLAFMTTECSSKVHSVYAENKTSLCKNMYIVENKVN